MKEHTVTCKCSACKGTGRSKTYEGNPVPCPYCNGKGKRTEKAPHPSHKMGRAKMEILAPSGTPRFYQVKTCRKCGLREESHPAGHFLNGLEFPCKERSAAK